MTLAGVAGAVDRRGAGEGQVLDIRAERVADRALTVSVPPRGVSMTTVAGIVDDVGVVAEPPCIVSAPGRR